MPKQYDILIIGGGFSGTTLACQLSRCCGREVAVAIVERSGSPGRGVAYRSRCSEHLLNVPAGNMSAFPERPDDFVEWLRKSNPSLAHSTEFVPRELFGRYVGEQLKRTLSETGIQLSWLKGEAIAIQQDEQQTTVQLLSGQTLATKYVILATGTFAPANPLPSLDQCLNYAKYAWSDGILEGLPDSGSVLLLGSGLTAIDQVLALHAAQFRGHVHLLSRRGLLPRMHKLEHKWTEKWTHDLPKTARGLLSTVRQEIRRAASDNIGWQGVIDSLRSSSNSVWQALPLEERKRFLRHVRPYWEAHRHRCAPQVQHVIDSLKKEDRLSVIAGRILDWRDEDGVSEVRYRSRSSGEELTLRVDRIVNCTGSEINFRELHDPLTRSLISRGLARPGALSLGLDVTEDGALVDVDGVPSKCLFAVGPLRKGCMWETTAVPEIRSQVKTLAACIADSIRQAMVEHGTH